MGNTEFRTRAANPASFVERPSTHFRFELNIVPVFHKPSLDFGSSLGDAFINGQAIFRGLVHRRNGSLG